MNLKDIYNSICRYESLGFSSDYIHVAIKEKIKSQLTKYNKMTKIKQLTNVLALCTIVGLSCWVGYLLSANEQKAITIEMYERSIDSANVINQSVHERDSALISTMPSKEELDWFYNFKNK